MRRYLIPLALLTVLSFLIGLPLAFVAFGSDIDTLRSPLYPFKSTIFQQDDFLAGGTGSGTVGTMGWAVNGSITRIASESGRPGLYRLDTTAVITTSASLNYFNSTALNPSNSHSILFSTRLNTNDANTTVRVGIGNGATVNPPTHGIYFEKLDADTNWFCVTRAGGVQTRTDSGVAVTTAFTNAYYTRNASGVTFGIDNAPAVCTHTTNIPTTASTPFVYIINSAAASKTVDVDYHQIMVTGLTR